MSGRFLSVAEKKRRQETLTFSVDPKVALRLERMSAVTRRPKSSYLREALDQWFERFDAIDPAPAPPPTKEETK